MMPLLPPPQDRHHLGSLRSSSTPRSPSPTTTAAAAAMPPQTRGAASTSSTSTPIDTTPKKKPSSSSIFSLKCGCKDAKSVSVSSSLSGGSDVKATDPADPAAAAHFSGRHHPPPALSAGPETSSADTITFTTATTSTSHDDDHDDDSPSFSGLLRQLNELERSVAAWDLRRGSSSRWAPTGRRGGAGEEEEEEEGEGGKARRCSTHLAGFDKVSGKAAGGFDAKGSIQKPGECRPRHRRTQSEGGGGRVLGKVGESVAVVKQTEDPLGDFRRSMLQMIVEKEILSGEELQELLCRFLALNSPSHHALIIRAFADIWRDVFSGYGRSPKAADLLVPPPVLRHGLPPYGRSRYYYSRRPSV